jgi:ligand-binding sensor domain-containing protein
VTALARGPDGRLWAGFADAALGFSFLDGEQWLPSPYSPALPDDRVSNILAAPDGAVWVATGRGLSRYDGERWRSFTPADGLPFQRINQLAYAYDSAWAAAAEGVARYDEASGWRTLDASAGLLQADVRLLAVAPDGRLWAGHDTLNPGLSVFDGNDWRAAPGLPPGPTLKLAALAFTRDGRLWAGGWYEAAAPGEPPGFLGMFDGASGWSIEPLAQVPRALRAGPDGRLWIAHTDSILVIDVRPEAPGRAPVEYPTLGKTVLDIEVSPNGAVWVSLAGSRALHVLSTGEWKPQYAAAFEGWRGITEIAFAPDGSLWAGSAEGDGAAHLAGVRRGWQYYRSASAQLGAAPAGSTLALAVEPGGAAWFSTTGGGLVRYGPDNSAAATLRALGPELVRAIMPAADGTVWAATDGDGVYRYERARWLHYAPDPALAAAAVQSFAVDRDGVAWIGTSRRVVRLSPEACEPDGRSARVDAQAAAPDPGGGLWFGTPEAGALRWNDDGESVWRVADHTGLAVAAVAPAADGSTWFLGSRGLTRYDGGTGWQMFALDESMPAQGLYSLAALPPLQAWAGTAAGVYHFNGREWRRFSTANGLADEAVLYLAAAADGSLWFATPGGLSRYQP